MKTYEVTVSDNIVTGCKKLVAAEKMRITEGGALCFYGLRAGSQRSEPIVAFGPGGWVRVEEAATTATVEEPVHPADEEDDYEEDEEDEDDEAYHAAGVPSFFVLTYQGKPPMFITASKNGGYCPAAMAEQNEALTITAIYATGRKQMIKNRLGSCDARPQMMIGVS